MAYSDYGRESNLGPWVSEIRYASTTAKEFNPSSLGEHYPSRPAYQRYGAPLMLGAYGGDDGLGFNLFKAIGGLAKGAIKTFIPIVGPAIATGIDAFKKRTTGAALEAVARNPAVQAAAVTAAKSEASEGFAKIAPYAIGGLVLLLVMRRGR